MSQGSDWMTPAEVARAVGARWTRPRRIRIMERLANDGVRVDVAGNERRVYLVNRESFEAYLADIREGRRPAPEWWLELHPSA